MCSSDLSLTDFYKIKSIDLGEITKHKFDIVYITNPAHLHIHFAIKFAKFGANIFIEKPLSSNLKKIALLSTIAGSLANAMSDISTTEAAIITFIATAANINLFGIGGAFWGLVLGLISYFIIPLFSKKKI